MECVLLQVVPFAQCTVDAGTVSLFSHMLCIVCCLTVCCVRRTEIQIYWALTFQNFSQAASWTRAGNASWYKF